MSKSLIMIGSGGHASVLYDALKLSCQNVLGVVDPKLSKNKKIFGDCQVLGSDKEILSFDPSEVSLVNGIGIIPNTVNQRLRISNHFRNLGYNFSVVIHPSSIISDNVFISEGVQIMAGTIIQNNTKIGTDSIINSGAVVDHDCIIGDNCHIAPNSTMCGSVKCGNECYIGAGATVIQQISIGKNTTIAAGTTVYKDVKENSIIKTKAGMIREIQNT